MKLIRSFNDTQLELQIPSSTLMKEGEITIEKGQSIIIIGANGAGKSRFCSKIAMDNQRLVHRIPAQKSLEFASNYSLSSFDDVMHSLLFGTDQSNQDKRYRWGWRDDEASVKAISDCPQAISVFFAQKNRDDEARSKQAVSIIRDGQHITELAPSVEETLMAIWNKVLPNRPLNIHDLKIEIAKEGRPYDARFMSDGERDVLYYLALCLCLPQNMFVIIDEPENHIHNSIINKLFTLLEQARLDLTFIYVTHNLDFAASHLNAKKLWFKEYDGTNWGYTLLEDEDDEIPEDLLFEILGAKEKVLLVEGTKNSLDTKLYQAFYKDYHVIGCGGCQQVISRVRAFNSHTLRSNYSVIGIVDRDYRTDEEINALRDEKIYTCAVAEVENLFLIQDFMRYTNVLLGNGHGIDFYEGKLWEKFNHDLEFQKVAAVNSEVKYQISKLDLPRRSLDDTRNVFGDLNSHIQLDTILASIVSKFDTAATSHNYNTMLQVYNQKHLINVIIRDLGFSSAEAYHNAIITAIQNGNESLVTALSHYLPVIDG